MGVQGMGWGGMGWEDCNGDCTTINIIKFTELKKKSSLCRPFKVETQNIKSLKIEGSSEMIKMAK